MGRPVGQPTKRTPEVEEAIISALKAGATHRMAADYAGIALSTLQRWLAEESDAYKEFQDAVKRASASGDLASLETIQTAARSGQWQAAAWLLERRHPGEYGRQRVEVTGKDGGPMQASVVIVPGPMASAEDWAKIANGEP